MRGKRHSDEVRAQAMAALLQGQGVTQVAEDVGLPLSTVEDMKRALLKSGQLAEVRTEKTVPYPGTTIASLVLNNLRASLEAQCVIASTVGTADYTRQQPAAEIAVLYGVLNDKSNRILTLMADSQHKPDEGEDSEV